MQKSMSLRYEPSSRGGPLKEIPRRGDQRGGNNLKVESAGSREARLVGDFDLVLLH